MSIKNKAFAVITAATIGATSLLPVATAKAANIWEDNCYKCGGLSTIATILEERKIAKDSKLCEHGHGQEGVSDVLYYKEARVRYYCTDCDVNWEEWVFKSLSWECQYK